jgi:hypothetical protein
VNDSFWNEVVCKGLRVLYVWPDLTVDVAQVVGYDERGKTLNLGVWNDDPEKHPDREVLSPLLYVPYVRYAPVGVEGTLVPNSWHV